MASPQASAAVAALREALGPDGVLDGASAGPRYHDDVLGNHGVPPLAVARPRTTADVSRALSILHGAGVPVVTQGGRTGLVLGQLPRDGEVVLSTERMTDIEEIDADAGTATVQCGVVLQALQDRLEPLGLAFPLDLGGRGSCTIGGNISTNAGGNRVIRYGMTRDLVLGLEAVLADGTVLDGLKPFQKNNTGVDLKQLFIGSEGVLGVVTRAVLRLVPRPRARCVAFCALDDFDRVRALLRHLRARLAGEHTAFEVLWKSYLEGVAKLGNLRLPMPDRHAFYVLAEASAQDAAALQARFEQVLGEALDDGTLADVVVAKNEAESLALWEMRDRAIDVSRTLDPIVPFDVSLKIADMNTFALRLDAALKALHPDGRAIVFGHAGDGNLHISAHQPPGLPDAFHAIEHTVYGLVREFGGSVSAEHGIGLLKREFLGHTRGAAEIETMRRLKAALDPRAILNRDRILSA
ncbi:MAG: FAD-binding oxidoreductase [Burkholderiaceae bacterium]